MVFGQKERGWQISIAATAPGEEEIDLLEVKLRGGAENLK